MSQPQASAPISTQSSVDDLRQALDGKIGESNLRDQALGFGKRRHLGPVGKLRACWSAVRLSGTALSVDVPHNVGTPAFCMLVDIEYPENAGTIPHVTAAQVRRSKWTATTCRMDIRTIVGSLDGAVAWFIVGGE